MKIAKINANNLRNDGHFQFYTEFRTLVERCGADKLKIASQYESFVTQYNDEDVVLKRINKSAYTAEIHEADKYRDEIWRGMADANKSAMNHYSQEVRLAAGRLKIVFDTYGNVARKPLDEETSAIYNILQDLRGKYADDAATVGINGWMDELENANGNLSRLMLGRYDETAGKTDLVMRHVRQKVDDAYHIIIERLNAAIIIEGGENYSEFVSTLNAVVKRYDDLIAQRKGKITSKKTL